MAYVKQNWSSNELITAEKLNHIENGIAGAKTIQDAVDSPSADGTGVSFIDYIEQDVNGKISATKKSVRIATTTAAGLMSANDKNTLINAVDKTGDTMTGNLMVEHEADSYVMAKNTATGNKVYLDSAPAINGAAKHGVWSDGYWNGSAFVENGKFIISRNTDGKVTVADHYNKDEVNELGVLYTDVNIGNVTIGSGGYMDIHNKIPSGKTPIATLIKTFGTATGAITVTADGQYVMGAQNTTVTDVVMRYYYRKQ